MVYPDSVNVFPVAWSDGRGVKRTPALIMVATVAGVRKRAAEQSVRVPNPLDRVRPAQAHRDRDARFMLGQVRWYF